MATVVAARLLGILCLVGTWMRQRSVGSMMSLIKVGEKVETGDGMKDVSYRERS